MSRSPNPRAAADKLYELYKNAPDWLDKFTDQLDRHRARDALSRILSVWGFSQSELARILGVSRQALSKWLYRGLPEERLPLIGDWSAATDILVHYLKRDRIPAVVRRPMEDYDDITLVDLLAKRDGAKLLRACREFFDFGQART